MGTDPTGHRPVVVVLIKGLGIGGAERLIAEGSRFWDRDQFDYRVAYLLPWKDQLAGELRARSVPLRCIGSEKGITPNMVFRLRRLLREWNADLVHAHLPIAGILARLVSKVPVVYTEHNLAWSYRPLTRIFNRLTYGRNDAVTAVSKEVAETISGYPGPTASVVTNGVAVALDSGAAAGARRELGLADEEQLVVHVGNIRPGKGHDLLVKATALLRDRGARVRVVSIGVEKRAGDLDRLRRMATERGLDDCLHFLGRRPDALAFIAAADVYVNPAQIEGLPVTILEAMALGRPVVATAVGGVASLIQGGVTGLTVDPESPDRLAAAIKRQLDDRPAALRMAEAGVRLVADNYGLEPMIRSYEAVYRRVLG